MIPFITTHLEALSSTKVQILYLSEVVGDHIERWLPDGSLWKSKGASSWVTRLAPGLENPPTRYYRGLFSQSFIRRELETPVDPLEELRGKVWITFSADYTTQDSSQLTRELSSGMIFAGDFGRNHGGSGANSGAHRLQMIPLGMAKDRPETYSGEVGVGDGERRFVWAEPVSDVGNQENDLLREVTRVDDETLVRWSVPAEVSNEDFELRAVDLDGRAYWSTMTHYPALMPADQPQDARDETYKIEISKIAGFELWARPYTWYKFENIQAYPFWRHESRRGTSQAGTP